MSPLLESISNWESILNPVAEVQRRQLLGYLHALSSVKTACAPDLAVLVFGSIAKGSCRPWSDIDLAIVSDRFSGMPWFKRVALLKANQSLFSLISPLGLTYGEYASYNYPAVIRFIRDNHIRLL